LSAGDIHLDAAPRRARPDNPPSTRIGSASSPPRLRRRLRFGTALLMRDEIAAYMI
jgi:hypothetical protein